MRKKLSDRMLEFKRDTNEYLIKKYFNQKYFDYKDEIIDVLIYRDEKKRKQLKSMNKSLTKRNLDFKRDTTEQLFDKFYNQKYFDYKNEIIKVFKYRDEKEIKRLKRLNKFETYKMIYNNLYIIKHNLPYKDSQLPF